MGESTAPTLRSLDGYDAPMHPARGLRQRFDDGGFEQGEFVAGRTQAVRGGSAGRGVAAGEAVRSEPKGSNRHTILACLFREVF